MRSLYVCLVLAAAALAAPQLPIESTTTVPSINANENAPITSEEEKPQEVQQLQQLQQGVVSEQAEAEAISGRSNFGAVTILGEQQFNSGLFNSYPASYSSSFLGNQDSNVKSLNSNLYSNVISTGDYNSRVAYPAYSTAYSSDLAAPANSFSTANVNYGSPALATYGYSAPVSSFSAQSIVPTNTISGQSVSSYGPALNTVSGQSVSSYGPALNTISGQSVNGVAAAPALHQQAIDTVHHVEVDRVVPYQTYTVKTEKVQVPVQRYVQTERVVPVKYDHVENVQEYETVAVRTAVPVQKYSVQSQEIDVPYQTLVRSEEVQQYKVESVTPVNEIQKFQIQKVVPVVTQQVKTEDVEVPVQRFVKKEELVPVKIQKVTPVQQTQRVSVQQVVPVQHVEHQIQHVQVPVQRLVKTEKVEHVRVQGVTPVPDVETHEIKRIVPVQSYQNVKERVAVPVRQYQQYQLVPVGPVRTQHLYSGANYLYGQTGSAAYAAAPVSRYTNSAYAGLTDAAAYASPISGYSSSAYGAPVSGYSTSAYGTPVSGYSSSAFAAPFSGYSSSAYAAPASDLSRSAYTGSEIVSPATAGFGQVSSTVAPLSNAESYGVTPAPAAL